MNRRWLRNLGAIVLAFTTTDLLANPKSQSASKPSTVVGRQPSGDPVRPMHSVARPLQEVTLTSVAGTVSAVFVEEGQHVQKGQRLLAFDTRMTQARVEMADAEYQSSLSAVKVAELESELARERYQQLVEAYRQGAATEVEVRESHVRMQQAKARHGATLDEVKLADERKNYAQVENELQALVAPFDGIAVRVFATPGQTPTPSQPLVRIVDVSKLRVDLYLPLDQYRRQGEAFTLIADSPVHRELQAQLVVIDRVIDPATQTIRCVLELDNRTHELPSGFRVELKPE